MAEEKTTAPATKPPAPAEPRAGAPAVKPAAATPQKPKGRGAAFKRGAITVLAALLVAGVCFGVGYFLGASGKANLEATAEAATRQARLLEARRRLDLSHVALENQNFGIAEGHLRAAAQKLAAVELEGPMEALARDVAETQIGVTGDITAQQQKLRSFIDRFDQLNPPAAGESATPATSDPE